MVEWVTGLPLEIKFVAGYLIFAGLFICWMLWACEHAPTHNEWD